MLIGGRFFAGVGGALASAVILGMIVTMFPEPREQAKAIGVYGFVASAGGSIGLLLGGILTQAISWHWIFVINLPIGIATAYGATRLVENKPGLGFQAGADIPGAALITSSLMIGVYAILGVSDHGWGSAQTLILFAVSFVLGATFITRQTRIENPLMPLRLFHSRNVVGANLIQAFLVAGMFGMFFLGALYLQRILGYDALQVGLAFLPTSIVFGLLLFARTPVDGNYLTDLLPPLLLVGLGVGTSFPSLMTLAMSGATPEDSGLASGVVSTSMQVGGAIGLAVLATLAAQRTDNKLADGAGQLAALNSGYHLAYLIGATLVAAAVVIAFTVLREVPMPSPEAMAEHAQAPAAEPEPEPAYSEG
jgi:MFS family permease